MTPEPSIFEGFNHEIGLGRLLRVNYVALQEEAVRRVNVAGFDDLRASHLLVLFVLGAGRQRPIELARASRMSRQALDYCLKSLAAGGYIRRTQGSKVNLRRIVTLTDKGIEATEVAILAGYEIEERCRQRVGPVAFDALRETLLALASDADN